MAERTIECDFGKIHIRTTILNTDGTNLAEGIELKGDSIDFLEIYGWVNIEELTPSDVNKLIIGAQAIYSKLRDIEFNYGSDDICDTDKPIGGFSDN